MTTHLETIRNLFPSVTRTSEQDMLIGSSCLSLTEEERYGICTYGNTARAFEIYRADPANVDDVTQRIGEAVFRGKVIGGISGGLVGAATGSVGGAMITAQFIPIPHAILGGAIVGGVGGAVTGAYVGSKIGGSKVNQNKVLELSKSSEVRRWTHDKYKASVFPPLMQYISLKNEDQIQLCPLTLNWMDEPVEANDHHIYEKTALLTHLTTHEARWPAASLAQLDPVERERILNERSPLRICNIHKEDLKPVKEYHANLFISLINNYNERVLHQKAVYAAFEKGVEGESLNKLFEAARMDRREADQVVRFYQTSEVEREDIVLDMESTINKSRLSFNEKAGVKTWLAATAKDPQPLLV